MHGSYVCKAIWNMCQGKCGTHWNKCQHLISWYEAKKSHMQCMVSTLQCIHIAVYAISDNNILFVCQ